MATLQPSSSRGSSKQWPHRQQQAQQLQLLLKLPQPPDMLIHGPSCTGKTSIVRHVTEGLPHAYVSCCRSLKLRSLLSSVVGQLTQGGKRKRAQAFAAASGTEHSLLWELKAACPPDQPCRILVLDDMQQLLAASEGPLGALLALREQAGVNLCLLLISRQQPAAQGLLGLLPGVVPLAFPAYSDSQLVDILAAAGLPSSPAATAAAAAAGLGGASQQDTSQQPSRLSHHQQQEGQHQQQQQEKLQVMYRRFLSNALVPQFHRLSRSLPDIQCQAAALWPKYLSGAAAEQRRQQQRDDGQGDEDVDQESLMYSAVTDKLQSALRAFQPATCCTLAAAAAGVGGPTGKQHRQGAAGAHMAAGLELCRLSKLLLVAAFLASRNKPSVDKQLFQQGLGGWRGRGGGRRRNALNADRQAEAAKAAELRGPHTFSLSRLTTIYSSLLAADENHSSTNGSSGSSGGRQGSWQQQQQGRLGQQGAALMPSAGWMGVHRSDVLMGVNTLVGSRLMSQACDDILEAPRFSCEAPQELIEQLAVDLSIPLTSYLKYV